MKLLQKSDLNVRGLRKTKQRDHILKVLQRKPLTIREIKTLLDEKHFGIHLVSIYRAMEIFVSMGLVRMIELGIGGRRYELVQHTNHHHHLICNNCGLIKDIVIPNENVLFQNTDRPHGYLVTDHAIEFFGLCGNCQ